MNLQDDPVFQALADKVSAQSELNLKMAFDLEKNTKATNEINDKVDKIGSDTQEVIAAFRSAKAAFDLIEKASKVAKIMIPFIVLAGYFGFMSKTTSDWVKTWMH